MPDTNPTSTPGSFVVQEPAHAFVADVTAAVASRVCQLPAVATLDWLDRAAECLLGVGAAQASCTLLGQFTREGRVVSLEATGVAISREARVASAERAIAEARAQIESLATLGFALPEAPKGYGAAQLSRLAGPAWAENGLAKVFTGQVPLVGWATLGAGGAGRRLVSCVWLGAEDAPRAEALAPVLGAVTSLLRERVRRAIGEIPPERGKWISPREQQVLDLLVLGRSVPEIAEAIGRSPHTVHDHVKALHRKLNASSRGELIARTLGFLQEPKPIARTSAWLDHPST